MPGAEGFSLNDLAEETVKPCSAHKYSFKHSAAMLSRCASKNTQCSCESSYDVDCRQTVTSQKKERVSLFVHDAPKKASGERQRGGGRGGDNGSVPIMRTLWAYEMDNVVTAYRWLIQNRSHKYPKCCEAVIVYQLKKSRNLPPGLYVYRTPPFHFGCTAERPLSVIDQFNFVSHSNSFGNREGLPSTITIQMFPGYENLSVMYVIRRECDIRVHEYGNRMFGEATAIGVTDSSSARNAISCQHHDVAMRTNRACVIDLRWKGFDTKTSCLKAIPRVCGLRALLWSNHSSNFQEIEAKVLTWIFGLCNELPKEVQMVDYANTRYGIRYLLIEMETFTRVLPDPPNRNATFFMHTHFEGDFNLAMMTIGEVPPVRSRMGSPCRDAFAFWYCLPAVGNCQPTPFSCGVKHSSPVTGITEEVEQSLLEWTRAKNGSSCLGTAVQYTLYYHARDMKYKMMVSHTVRDADTTLDIFRL